MPNPFSRRKSLQEDLSLFSFNFYKDIGFEYHLNIAKKQLPFDKDNNLWLDTFSPRIGSTTSVPSHSLMQELVNSFRFLIPSSCPLKPQTSPEMNLNFGILELHLIAKKFMITIQFSLGSASASPPTSNSTRTPMRTNGRSPSSSGKGQH